MNRASGKRPARRSPKTANARRKSPAPAGAALISTVDNARLSPRPAPGDAVQPAEPRLDVAVIGVGGCGERIVACLKQLPAVRVVGVSDKQASSAQNVGQKYSVASYNDNRCLLAETQPKAVFLAVPPQAGGELIEACAQRGMHVWKEMPLARNLDEAVALVRRMDSAGLKFAIGTQRRFAAGYQRARQLREQLGLVFLARSHYLYNFGPYLGWRGDKSTAGGGALLELGYHCIDLMIYLLGLPEEVYGFSAQAKPGELKGPDGKLLPIYDTDDTAAAIMRYGRECMATVVTTRISGPVSEELSLHGRDGSLTASSSACRLRDREGNVLDELSAGGGDGVLASSVEAFIKAIASGKERYECSARENLLTMAVIEAIYLSDQTSQPENPSRLLKTRGVTIEHCLALRPES